MIHLTKGNIIESQAEALVNTVNTVGVMGKGIALQFKEKFPLNYKLYKKACEQQEVMVGKMFVTATNSIYNPQWIINFPTKKNWIHKSSYSYIEHGLDDLVKVINDLKIKSIAIPPLGSGQGGLEWPQVKGMILGKLSHIPADIYIYEPGYWAKSSAKQNNKAGLTKPRALILALMIQYRRLGYDISLLEIQKLAYFLQVMGQQDLKLNFTKLHYGPYAHNLQHLLHLLEKNYLIVEKPILDSKPFDIIYSRKDKYQEIHDFIRQYCTEEEKRRLNLVNKIITGYESPFGLELLATIEWIIQDRKDEKDISSAVIESEIIKWSKRKSESFSPGLITKAFEHLGKVKAEYNA